MLRFKTAKALLIGAAAISASLAFGPLASAEPCQNTGGATVCESNGSASMSAAPEMPEGGALDQNGPYGPSGDYPPFGR